jgi:hypothetical protein
MAEISQFNHDLGCAIQPEVQKLLKRLSLLVSSFFRQAADTTARTRMLQQ